MSEYEVTGGGGNQMMIRGAQLVPNSVSIGTAPELYVHPYFVTRSSVDTPRRGTQQKSDRAVVGLRLADRRLFAVLLQKAVRCSSLLEEAGDSEEDAVDRANAGHDLLEYLEELWVIRDLREREWQKLLAVLQSALFRAVFEKFSLEQCRTVHGLVSEYLTDSSISRDKLSLAIKLLRKARIDPWSGLSEKSAK